MGTNGSKRRANQSGSERVARNRFERDSYLDILSHILTSPCIRDKGMTLCMLSYLMEMARYDPDAGYRLHDFSRSGLRFTFHEKKIARIWEAFHSLMSVGIAYRGYTWRRGKWRQNLVGGCGMVSGVVNIPAEDVFRVEIVGQANEQWLDWCRSGSTVSFAEAMALREVPQAVLLLALCRARLSQGQNCIRRAELKQLLGVKRRLTKNELTSRIIEPAVMAIRRLPGWAGFDLRVEDEHVVFH